MYKLFNNLWHFSSPRYRKTEEFNAVKGLAPETVFFLLAVDSTDYTRPCSKKQWAK
jgi:hypothetical protein